MRLKALTELDAEAWEKAKGGVRIPWEKCGCYSLAWSEDGAKVTSMTHNLFGKHDRAPGGDQRQRGLRSSRQL